MFRILRTGFPLFLLIVACNGPSGTQATEKEEVEITLGKVEFADRTYPTFSAFGLTWLAANLDLPVADSWCYGDRPANCETYGRLYRWNGARQACSKLGPDWRLPSDAEWQALARGSGGYFDWLADRAAGDPAAANRALGFGPPQSGRNGFHARLGGWRGSNGGYDSKGEMGFYWTAGEKDEDQAWFFIFLPDGGKLTRRSTKKRMGMSCRCVREAQ